MTKLYFLRHGKADWPEWDRPDDERPLTPKGQKQMKRVAKALAKSDVQPALILSSPLPRAWQTAEFVAGALALEVTLEPALAPGFDTDQLRMLLKKHAGKGIMLVGHEPDFSEAIAALIGGEVLMAKASIACVEVADANALDGQLLWLVTPKFLR